MIFLLTVFTIIIVTLFSIGWLVHISMVKDSSKQGYGWTGHKKFIEEFHKVEWDYQSNRFNFPNSLFSNEYGQDQYHAGIITFNYRGMIINNPISYCIVKMYVKKHIISTYGDMRRIDKWR